MVYAEVIVGSRTNVQELTYAVPAPIIPYIRLGSTVMVELRRRKVRAVVVGLTSHVAKEIKSQLKEVLEVDKKGLGFNPQQVKTIEELAAYYGASLAEVAYHALIWPQQISAEKTAIKSVPPTFIQAQWPDRKTFYLDLLKKYPNESFVFGLGSVQYLEDFAADCRAQKHNYFDLRQAKDERQLRQQLSAGERFICLGLQKVGFVSLKPKDFLIIDQPDGIVYKQQRRPHMSVKRIALVRSMHEGIRLVMGANSLALSDYLHRINRTWRVIEKRLEPIELIIHDRRGSKDLLLPSLLGDIAGLEPILFLAASKAWAPAVVCRSCGQSLKCGNCHRTISAQSKMMLGCLYCGQNQPFPVACPNCHGTELVTIGEGSLQLFQKLQTMFGAPKVALVSSLTKEAPTKQLVVATEKIMNYPTPRFAVAVIANMDRPLAGTDADGSWQLLDLLLQLRVLAKKIVVQTYFPDHWVWSAAATGELRQYYQHELATRKRYRLPPFGQRLAVLASGRDVKELERQAEEISEKITTALPHVDVGEFRIFSNPGGSIGRIYLHSNTILSTKQKQQLRATLPLSWSLDVEP